MNYFNYSKVTSSYDAMEIYSVVMALKGYAKTIYKGLWEDALDKSFFHILENYKKESGGDLEHYATRVVGTILLGKYSKEIEHEVSLITAMDKKSLETKGLNPAEILIPETEEVSNDLKDCVEYLLPMFVQDYKFFKTRNPEDRKLTYEGLFSEYSYLVISSAMDFLVGHYAKQMDELLEVKKTCHYRKYQADRYKRSLDSSVDYQGFFNGVVLYKTLNGKSNKKMYLWNIESTLKDLIAKYYKSGKQVQTLGDLPVYCTLSGSFVTSEEELISCLENEFLGAVLARFQNLKVVSYERGKSLLVTSTQDLEDGLVFEIFSCSFTVKFKRLIAKCINMEEIHC